MKQPSLKDQLAEFAGVIGGLATNAPSGYPSWSYRTYESEVSEAPELWASIRGRLTRDLDSVALIDMKLEAALMAFRMERWDEGRKALWDIYNVGLHEIR